MESFDPSRPPFSAYGFTCDRWQAKRMSRSNRHNEIELNYLPLGSLDYMHGGKKIHIPTGQLTAFWAAIPHQVVDFADLEEYFVATLPLVWFLGCNLPVSLTQSLLRGEVHSEIAPKSSRQSKLDRRLDIGRFTRWTEDFASGDTTLMKAARLEIHARLERFALTAAASHPSQLHPGTLHQTELSKAELMAAFIALEYTQSISVSQVSQAVGLHPSHAMAIFTKTFGLSIMEFVRQHRLAQAQSLLVSTDDAILQIALAAGFQSVSQFYAVFKEYCECSPRDYRMQHRE